MALLLNSSSWIHAAVCYLLIHVRQNEVAEVLWAPRLVPLHQEMGLMSV